MIGMELTFFGSGSGGGLRGVAPNGLVLFGISASTTRGDESVTLSTELPGYPRRIRVPAPEEESKWSPAVNALAMEQAAEMVRDWARNVLGVEVDVSVVNATAR